VQVGALARVHLVAFYAADERLADARVLAQEVVNRFRGAVDHDGRPLVETPRSLGML
jgi:hypothetical protein